MFGYKLAAGSVCLGASLLAAASLPGDAKQGAAIFREEKCVTCHSVNGEGGGKAPDLGKRTSRGYSPSEMAALMWNHAPRMWSAMDAQGIAKPALDEQKASDLFAYFFAARYFEKPGDAARGRKLFVDKRCADCHNLNSGAGGAAPAVSDWESLADPIALAEQMWNHAPQMKAAMDKKGVKWPALASQELTDILVYLQNLPQAGKKQASFAPASPATGQELFRLKGCAECHKGAHALEGRYGQRTLTDFAAAMWNHAPQMTTTPKPLNRAEMSRLVGYLWSVQFFDERGSKDRGQRVFSQKGCAGCHTSGPGPKLAGGGSLGSFSMVAALWKHGPAMQAEMKKKNAPWPRFQGTQMPDLVAYLNSLK